MKMLTSSHNQPHGKKKLLIKFVIPIITMNERFDHDGTDLFTDEIMQVILHHSDGPHLPARTDDSMIHSLKLWRDFVDWAHCHDLPLVVGAYAIYDKYSRLQDERGEKRTRLAFVSLTKNAKETANIVEIDRVSTEIMSDKLEKLMEYTRELIDGDTKLPLLENDGDCVLVPERMFRELDTGTLPREEGCQKALVMPPALEKKKIKWAANTKRFLFRECEEQFPAEEVRRIHTKLEREIRRVLRERGVMPHEWRDCYPDVEFMDEISRDVAGGAGAHERPDGSTIVMEADDDLMEFISVKIDEAPIHYYF